MTADRNKDILANRNMYSKQDKNTEFSNACTQTLYKFTRFRISCGCFLSCDCGGGEKESFWWWHKQQWIRVGKSIVDTWTNWALCCLCAGCVCACPINQQARARAPVDDDDADDARDMKLSILYAVWRHRHEERANSFWNKHNVNRRQIESITE